MKCGLEKHKEVCDAKMRTSPDEGVRKAFREVLNNWSRCFANTSTEQIGLRKSRWDCQGGFLSFLKYQDLQDFRGSPPPERPRKGSCGFRLRFFFDFRLDLCLTLARPGVG